MMYHNLDLRQSTLIQAMRFPLLVLVLYVHSNVAYVNLPLKWEWTGWDLYHFVSSMFSQNFCAIANCWFFALSGYLFFLKSDGFGKEWILKKWERRIYTLLIPFLIWNTIMILCILFKNELFGLLSGGKSYAELETVIKGPFYWFFSGPADFPLWFLRDLIIMSIIAPLLYPIIRRTGFGFLFLMAILYVLPWSLHIPSILSIVYFSIGAWMSIQHRNLVAFCHSYRYIALLGAIILLPLATIQMGRPLHWLFLRLFIPFGMVCFLNLCNKIIDRDSWKKMLCQLSSVVFFVYAIHEIYILGWIKGLFLRIFGESLTATWISYLFVPVATLFLCLSLYAFFKRMSPKLLAFTCGGRV